MKRNCYFLSISCKERVNSFVWIYATRKNVFGVIGGILLLLPGCSGGKADYYPQKIALNTINLQKIELSGAGITSYEQQFFPVSYNKRALRNRVVKEGEKIFGTSGYFQEIRFLGNEYYLHENDFFTQIDIIRKKDMKRVLYFYAPRTIGLFSAFPIVMGKQNFLVIYVEQRATSHSSTLLIVDSQFKIVYREHLLGAEEIGYTHSDQYGNCIVLKSEDFWFPNGIDKPRVSINGDWLYYIPYGQAESDSAHHADQVKKRK